MTLGRALQLLVVILIITVGLWLLWALVMGGFCSAPANAACA